MNVRLRPLEEDDLRRIYDWQRDPALYDHLVGDRREVAWEEARAWMRRHWLHQEPDHRYALCADGVMVGCVYLLAVDGAAGVLEFHVFIGDGAARGNGIGRAALAEALRIAFDALDAVEVRLEVLETNDRARRIYDDAGFRETGSRIVDKSTGPVRALAMALDRRRYADRRAR